DITLQYVGITAHEIGTAIQRFMCPFAFTIGVGIEDKFAFVDRANDVAERMVSNPIPKRCSTDLATFGIVDGKTAIIAGLIAFFEQFLLQRHEFHIQILLKSRS